MKAQPLPPTTTALLAAAALSVIPTLTHAAETLAPPVGEYRVPMPVGSSVWVYGLVTADAWTGTAEWAVTNQTLAPGKVLTEITIGGESLPSAVINGRAHYVEVLDGAWTGLMLDVFGCTATKVIVHGDCAVMEPGTRLAVRAHATLGTMFPVPDCGLVAGADVVMAACPDGAGDFVERWFMHNGGNWEDAGSLEPADDVVVYPGQGMIFNLGELPGGAARELVFGRGPVCHVNGSALYFGMMTSRHWLTQGVP